MGSSYNEDEAEEATPLLRSRHLTAVYGYYASKCTCTKASDHSGYKDEGRRLSGSLECASDQSKEGADEDSIDTPAPVDDKCHE